LTVSRPLGCEPHSYPLLNLCPLPFSLLLTIYSLVTSVAMITPFLYPIPPFLCGLALWQAGRWRSRKCFPRSSLPPTFSPLFLLLFFLGPLIFFCISISLCFFSISHSPLWFKTEPGALRLFLLFFRPRFDVPVLLPSPVFSSPKQAEL